MQGFIDVLNAIQQKLKVRWINKLVLMSICLHARPADEMKVDMNWLRRFLDISNGYALVLLSKTVMLNCNMSAKRFVESIIE